MSEIEDKGSFRASRSIPVEREDGAEVSVLIKRLEKAEAGSRELDRDLAKLIDRSEWDKCANWASMPCGAPPDAIDRDALRWLPTYTTSLDAALALAERVLPGCEPGFMLEQRLPQRSIWAAWVRPYPEDSSFAATPALALCIAILRAPQGKA